MGVFDGGVIPELFRVYMKFIDGMVVYYDGSRDRVIYG